MMQSLRTSPNAALIVAFGAKSNITDRLSDRNLKLRPIPILSRRATVSWRKRIVKLHHPVQVSWGACLPTSPLLNTTVLSRGLNNSEKVKIWTRSVASLPHENLETRSDPQASCDASKESTSRRLSQAKSHVEGISNENLEIDQCNFAIGRGFSSVKNIDGRHVSDTPVKDSFVQEDPDSVDGRQSEARTPNAENDTEAKSGNVGVGERVQGENAVLSGNADNQDLPKGRKRMGRPKRKKKKAYSAGIATYDPGTNSILLKESATETPAASHRVNSKQQRQRSPRPRQLQPVEEGVQGARVKSGWKDDPLEQVTGSVREIYSYDRSRGQSLGVEEWARLSRLLRLEDIENINDQPNPNLIPQDDASREQFGEGGKVQLGVESKEDAPSQAFPSDAPEVALKSSPMNFFPGAKETSKAKGFEQDFKPGKGDVEVKNIDVKVAAGTVVGPYKARTENPQVQQVQSNASFATESITITAGQMAESISSTATQVSESVTKAAAKISNSLTEILKDGVDAEDEFEESNGSDRPEFQGLRGLKNYKVIQEDQGILVKIRDFYFFMMKKSLPEFALGMMAAPLALSTVFTLLYLPEFQGLAYDETARDFMKASTGIDGGAIGLELSWMTFFHVFMFSLSLSTGLQPELAPLSPYALVVANLNSLSAQLTLAFLSAAVFERLSQPSEPVRCSSVALICSHNRRRSQKRQALNKVLLTRCVLAGPQPCEIVDVKLDLTYRFNTVSNEGSFFRGSYRLKLVRSQIALLDQGMQVRHVIDESSPLYSQSPQSLRQKNAIFVLSVGGIERSSMQPVFHVQFYSVCDEQVIWNAEFEDMILINQRNQRVVDHSKLSSWRSL